MGKKIWKEQLVEEIYNKLDGFVHKKDVKAVVDTLFETIAEHLKKGDTVTIRGYFMFHMSRRKARRSVNPTNPKETIMLPERYMPAVKVSSVLRKALTKEVNGKKKKRKN